MNVKNATLFAVKKVIIINIYSLLNINWKQMEAQKMPHHRASSVRKNIRVEAVYGNTKRTVR